MRSRSLLRRLAVSMTARRLAPINRGHKPHEGIKSEALKPLFSQTNASPLDIIHHGGDGDFPV